MVATELPPDTSQAMARRIELWPVDKLVPYARNARTHTLHDPVRWKYAILGDYFLNGKNPPLHAWS